MASPPGVTVTLPRVLAQTWSWAVAKAGGESRGRGWEPLSGEGEGLVGEGENRLEMRLRQSQHTCVSSVASTSPPSWAPLFPSLGVLSAP